MTNNVLYDLVEPVLDQVCKCYAFKQNGVEVDYLTINTQIKTLIKDIKQQASLDQELLGKFQQIEMPLIFFIDYFFIENGFSYSGDYQPLAHSYNELSGDEKFFDLLESQLSSNQVDEDVLEVFYAMLALGFDGAYKREPNEVLKFMSRCREHMTSSFNPNKEVFCPNLSLNPNKQHENLTSWFSGEFIKNHVVLLLSILTFGLFVVCALCIYINSAQYYQMLDKVLDDASPYNNIQQVNPKTMK